MISPGNSNWPFEYGLIDDIQIGDGNMVVPASGFAWPTQTLNGFSNVSSEADGSFGNSDVPKETGSKKRVRSESCNASSSKACREKLRRDRLNEKFVELGSILEPERPPKTDKSAILIEAIRMVTHLQSESQKLKESNSNLLEKIKELKAEKNELRDEKQRLKAEKDELEQKLKTSSVQRADFVARGDKLASFVGYPGVAMWRLMPAAAVDTSQDHVLRPPVA